MNAAGANNDSVRDFMLDVDRTLLRENLKLTPEQRLEKFSMPELRAVRRALVF